MNPTHLNVIVPLPERLAVLLDAGRHEFLTCEPEASQVLVYHEDVPDSSDLTMFAITHGLLMVHTNIDGSFEGVPFDPRGQLFLYRVSRTNHTPYDAYNGFICATYFEERARLLSPDGPDEHGNPLWSKALNEYDRWVDNTDSLSVTHIGMAADGMSEGIVMTSFRHG